MGKSRPIISFLSTKSSTTVCKIAEQRIIFSERTGQAVCPGRGAQRLTPLILLLLLAGQQIGCIQDGQQAAQDPIRTGALVLRDNDFDSLSGKRVGLIANQTAVAGSVHLIDLLHEAPNVELVALFGPEHGLRGQSEAGAAVTDGVDTATGIPVYSLYGSANAPSEDVLVSLDVLVFDIQDIGARFYTYITTMGRSMQSASRAGIPFVVLDRPNPLGGVTVDGYVLESEFASGVGLYPIPIQHGLTVGELALMIKGEGYLDGLEDLDLEIVPMSGWTRDMLWPDTGLKWIPTSPNIPTFETAQVYIGTVFFEGTDASEGRGTDEPFLTIGAPWLDAHKVQKNLQNRGLPGVRFEAALTSPRAIPGAAINPKFEGVSIEAISISVEDTRTYNPLATGIALLSEILVELPDSLSATFLHERWLNLLSGSSRLYRDLLAGTSTEKIRASWAREVKNFERLRTPYLLYR